MSWMQTINWRAWMCVLALIIGFREASVWLMTQWGQPELGNLTGLLSLLAVLLIWRRFKGIPVAWIETNNKMMKESAFAFLPICAGSLIMLIQLGNQLYMFIFVLCLSTLFPLWLFAKIAKRFL